MLRHLHPLVRWALAGFASAIVCTAACLFFGYVLPTWIFGPDRADSPTSGQVFSVALSFASAYSVLLFILLTVFLYQRFSTLPPRKRSSEL